MLRDPPTRDFDSWSTALRSFSSRAHTVAVPAEHTLQTRFDNVKRVNSECGHNTGRKPGNDFDQRWREALVVLGGLAFDWGENLGMSQ